MTNQLVKFRLQQLFTHWQLAVVLTHREGLLAEVERCHNAMQSVPISRKLKPECVRLAREKLGMTLVEAQNTKLEELRHRLRKQEEIVRGTPPKDPLLVEPKSLDKMLKADLVKEMELRGYKDMITPKTVRWDMILQIREDVKQRCQMAELEEIRRQSLGAAFQTPPVVVGPAASSMDTSEPTGKRKSKQ
jgi:hypothetical protein